MNKYIAIIIFSDESILDNIAEISATFINEMMYESSVVVVFDSAFRLNEIKTYLMDSGEDRIFIISEYHNSVLNLPEGAEEYLTSPQPLTTDEISYEFSDPSELRSFKQSLTTEEAVFFDSNVSVKFSLDKDINMVISEQYDTMSDVEKSDIIKTFVNDMSEEDKAETLETLEAKLPNLTNLEKDLMKFIIINELD